MNILVVCDVFGDNTNGTMVAQNNLINSMRKRGHHVSILCADQNSMGQPDVFVCPNLNVGPFNSYVEKEGVTLPKPKRDIIEKSMEGIDVVHIMQPLLLGPKAASIAYEKNIAITAGFHTQAENVSAQFKLMGVEAVNKTLYKYFWRALYRYCDAIHYPTQFIRNIFEENIQYHTNGYVISNGVLPIFRKNRLAQRPKEWEGKYLIVFSGRLTDEKNQVQLMRAILLSKHKDKIQLVLAGDGPLKEKLIKMGESLPNKPYINFFTRPQVVDLMSEADLYVHAAVADLESISCLEAICCGALPLLSDSPKAAVSEYSRNTHCVFKCGDDEDLARHIDWFIEHPEESAQIKTLYNDFYKNYNFEHCMDRMEQMIKDAYRYHAEGHKKPIDLGE